MLLAMMLFSVQVSMPTTFQAPPDKVPSAIHRKMYGFVLEGKRKKRRGYTRKARK